jgi:uncharacterized protein YdeI (YjbR/CyaY-like superfamily)
MLMHEGVPREYVVHVPPSYDGQKFVPLVIDIHGYTYSETDQESVSGWKQKSDAEGFIVVYPKGLDSSWNGGSVCCSAPFRTARISCIHMRRRRERRSPTWCGKCSSVTRSLEQPMATRKTSKTKKVVTVELELMEFADGAAFRTWLERNHAKSPGVWSRMAKKGSGATSITRPEAVDAALRWGWIDGQGKSIDANYWKMKFTPRRARSIWSKINCASALALIERGEMQPPGLAAVERAKADGRWEAAYDPPRTAALPEDFAKALAKKPKAKAAYEKLNSANRYAMIWRLQTAKKAETRAKRIEQFVAMLLRGEKIHP